MSRLPSELLDQARLLARKEPRRPKQASLRRAVSGAYYALFHHLAWDAAGTLSGRSQELSSLRKLAVRAFEHRSMSLASRAFAHDRLPETLRRAVGGRVPAQLTEVAKTFVLLQELRHRADYDLDASFGREDVLLLIDQAEVAMGCWSGCRRDRAARVYQASLLTWNKIKSH